MIDFERIARTVLRALDLTDAHGRTVARAVVAGALSAGTLAVVALNEHAPLDIEAGTTARIVAAAVPLLAAALVALAVLRPRLGLPAILLLTPVVDVAQVSWIVGPVQVISQTILMVVLAAGLALRAPGRASTAAAPAPAAGSDLRSRFTLERLALAGTIALLALAGLSTAVSPDVQTSFSVLLHGILEPIAIGVALLVLRPTVRYLSLVAIVLGASVAIGGLLNMIQTLAVTHSLTVLQAERLLFSRITYFNVGLFGEMLAMAMPLLLAALIGRRRFGLSRPVVALLAVATLIALAGLFLTFSKSAYLSTAGGSLVLVLLAVRGWRRRATIVVTAGLLSAVVVPWPAFFLQVSPPLENAYRTAVVSIIGQSRYDSWDPSTLSGRGSLLERWYATRAAAEMAVDHPILGIGLNEFQNQYVPGRYRPPEAHLALDSAHSMWAELAAELGFPVLCLVLLVYGAALLALARVYRAPSDEATRLLAAALLAALIAWLMVGTAFAGDMYRDWRNMASDYVMAMVVVAAAFALYRLSRVRAAGATAGATAGA